MNITIFRLVGIPVRLHFSWFFAFGLITWSLSTSLMPSVMPAGGGGVLPMSIAATFLIFASVVLHEFGHAMAARRNGVKVGSVDLFFFGGIAKIKSELPSPWSEFWFALAGPIVSLAFAAGLYMFNNPVAHYIAQVNLFIFCFNLIPVFPLDGGRMLRAVLWQTKGDYIWATEIACKIAFYFSTAFITLGIGLVVLSVIGTGIWLLLIGGFIRLATHGYYQQVSGLTDIHLKVGDLMVPKDQVVSIPVTETIQVFMDKYFLVHGFHSFPVTDNNKEVIGLLTYWYVRKKLLGKEISEETPIREVFLAIDKVPSVPSSVLIALAMEKIFTSGFNTLFVSGPKGFAGIITRSAIGRAKGSTI